MELICSPLIQNQPKCNTECKKKKKKKKKKITTTKKTQKKKKKKLKKLKEKTKKCEIKEEMKGLALFL